MSKTDGRLKETMEKMSAWARINSPWAIHFNSGSCNGCDIEILATFTPRYDVERFGIRLKGSPRHADVLVVTGAVSEQAKERLKRIYEQMPDPKFVVAVGACALGGGVFRDAYNVVGQVDKVIPVDAYIPGCPPRPEAIIDGIVKLLSGLQAPAEGAPATEQAATGQAATSEAEAETEAEPPATESEAASSDEASTAGNAGLKDDSQKSKESEAVS